MFHVFGYFLINILIIFSVLINVQSMNGYIENHVLSSQCNDIASRIEYFAMKITMIWAQTLGLINSTEKEVNDSTNQLFNEIIHFFRSDFHFINFNIAQFAAINPNTSSYDTLFQSHPFILCDENGIKNANSAYLNPEESFSQFFVDIMVVISNIMSSSQINENKSLCQIGANIDGIVQVISDESSRFIQTDNHANNHFKSHSQFSLLLISLL
jgi:hypothetical protein